MIPLALRRLASAIPLLLGVLTLTFAIAESAPGSPADLWIGDRPVPPQVRARIEQAYGLDRPPVARYFHWLGSVALRGAQAARSRLPPRAPRRGPGPRLRRFARTLPARRHRGLALRALHPRRARAGRVPRARAPGARAAQRPAARDRAGRDVGAAPRVR